MRYIQFLCNRFRTLVVKIVHHQRHSEFLGQLSNGLFQIGIRAGPRRRLRNPSGQDGFPLLPAPRKIYALVLGYADNPLAELLTTAKLTYSHKTLQHRILSHVLGIVNIAQHTQTNGKHAPVMSLDEQRVRTLVAALTGCNQNFIRKIIQAKFLTPLP
jgi:hypothetical protein